MGGQHKPNFLAMQVPDRKSAASQLTDTCHGMLAPAEGPCEGGGGWRGLIAKA